MESLPNEPGISVDERSLEAIPQTEEGRRRLLTLVLGVVGISAAIVTFSISSARHSTDVSPQEQNADLTALTLDLSLLSQQLDELFRYFVERVSRDAELTPEDRIVLESWLEFDERFIERTQDREVLKFEQVNAHLRLGHGLYLLQMIDPSIAHFESAIDLLNQLRKGNPKVDSYPLDQSDAYYGLGRSLRVVGRNEEALAAIETSIKLLSDPRYPPEVGRQARLTELYKQKRELLDPNVTAQ